MMSFISLFLVEIGISTLPCDVGNAFALKGNQSLCHQGCPGPEKEKKEEWIRVEDGGKILKTFRNTERRPSSVILQRREWLFSTGNFLLKMPVLGFVLSMVMQFHSQEPPRGFWQGAVHNHSGEKRDAAAFIRFHSRLNSFLWLSVHLLGHRVPTFPGGRNRARFLILSKS